MRPSAWSRGCGCSTSGAVQGATRGRWPDGGSRSSAWTSHRGSFELASKGAPPGASFVVGDAGNLGFDAEFEVVISLCQGGFGLVRGEDASVLDGMVRAVHPGGQLALTAFSAYFCVSSLEDTDAFDAATGVNVEQTTLKDESGTEIPFVLETTCFTPRELRLLFTAAGAEVEHLWSTSPGAYAANPPDLDHPEWLVVARKPGVDVGAVVDGKPKGVAW